MYYDERTFLEYIIADKRHWRRGNFIVIARAKIHLAQKYALPAWCLAWGARAIHAAVVADFTAKYRGATHGRRCGRGESNGPSINIRGV